MFEKLLSTVPYNPSMVHQLAFYGKRMREESTVRRAGLILLVMAFLIQFFAVISPPQASVADSTNDLVNGGISSAADAAHYCETNVKSYGDILNNYGITCNEVAHAPTVSLKSTDNGNQLFSMGRNDYGQTNPRTHKATGQTPVTVTGAGSLYVRHLSSFDSGPYSTYQALRVTNSHGTFYILYNCGNLVSIGVPVAYTPPKPCIYNSAYQAVDSRCKPPTPAPAPTPKPTPTPTPTPKPVCPLDSSLLQSDSKCQVCDYNSTILASNAACKPCDKAVSSANALACVVINKTAVDLTTAFADPNHYNAVGGDTILYTLSARNDGKATVKDYVFNEQLSDTLDYADVSDSHGGTLAADKTISWPAIDIKPGATVTQQITVKIKNPIPMTPVSNSDQAHFDLIMTNVYGNTITIYLPPTVAKTVEVTATKLVNTGPGTSLFIGAVLVIAAGYFYSRSRLLATESAIAVQENTSGGL